MSRNDDNSQIIDLKNEGSVKRVIGVVSGKGGVGKSFVTSEVLQLILKKISTRRLKPIFFCQIL